MGQLLRLPDDCSSACLSGNRGVLHTRTNSNTNSESMRRQIELKSRRNNEHVYAIHRIGWNRQNNDQEIGKTFTGTEIKAIETSFGTDLRCINFMRHNKIGNNLFVIGSESDGICQNNDQETFAGIEIKAIEMSIGNNLRCII